MSRRVPDLQDRWERTLRHPELSDVLGQVVVLAFRKNLDEGPEWCVLVTFKAARKGDHRRGHVVIVSARRWSVVADVASRSAHAFRAIAILLDDDMISVPVIVEDEEGAFLAQPFFLGELELAHLTAEVAS